MLTNRSPAVQPTSQVLEYADAAGADLLRAYCLAVGACNLDAVLLEAGGAFEELPPHLLAELERVYKLRLAGAGAKPAGGPAAAGQGGAKSAASASAGGSGWQAQAGEVGATSAPAAAARPGSRLQPGLRPTAAAPWLGDAGLGLEEEEALLACGALPLASLAGADSGSSFLDRQEADAAAAAQRLLRTLHKKLQQIESLEARAAGGAALDPQQRAKVEARPVIQSAVAALGSGMAAEDVQAILRAAAGGREGEEDAAAGSSGSSKAAAAAAAASSGSSSSKPPKPKRGSSTAGEASAAPPGAAAEASEAFLGSSPPAASLVPAFGAAGSVAAAAEQLHTPSAEGEQPSMPGGGMRQVRSQVGFATGGLAAGQDEGPPSLARLSSGSRPKSAAKRKGELGRRESLFV